MSGHRKWSDIRKGSAREDREPLRTLGELRRESGLSQQEMAEELGVSQVSVSKIEHQDDPQVSTLMRYLGAMGANLELRAVFPDKSARLYFLTDADTVDEETSDDLLTVGRSAP
jgi:transcriptional regulator with XRE-family HTH domain